MAKCAVCGTNPAEGGKAVFRANAVGEVPAVWACKEHLKQVGAPNPDAVVLDIVSTVERMR